MKAGPKGGRDLTPLPWRTRTKGARQFALFCKRYLKVPRGKGAKRPFVVRDWQAELVGKLLDDRRHLNVWVLPRGNGKSGLAAAIALHHLFMSGEEGARVIIVAQDERRASALLRTAARMVETSDELDGRAMVYKDRIVVPGTDSQLLALPAEAHRVEGEDASLVIVDEIGFVPRETFEAALLSAGKREHSQVLCIGTPSPPRWRDKSPLLDLVLAGRSGTDDTMTLVEYGAPPGCDLKDEGAWAAANPAFGDWLTPDVFRANLPPKTREAEFRRARLGQWVQHDDTAFVTEQQWGALARPGVAIPPGTPVVLALDGSQRDDSTALLVLSVSRVPHVVVGGLWEPSRDDALDEVVVADVEDRIRELAATYRVRELVADPWGWNRTLQVLADEGLPVSQFNQNTSRLTPATTDLHAAIVDGKLTHDGDPDLARHVLAATVDANDRGIRLKKTNHTLKIDAAAALVMGYSRADWLASNKARTGRKVRGYRQ
mgnify:CR=1 FL=1